MLCRKVKRKRREKKKEEREEKEEEEEEEEEGKEKIEVGCGASAVYTDYTQKAATFLFLEILLGLTDGCDTLSVGDISMQSSQKGYGLFFCTTIVEEVQPETVALP